MPASLFRPNLRHVEIERGCTCFNFCRPRSYWAVGEGVPPYRYICTDPYPPWLLLMLKLCAHMRLRILDSDTRHTPAIRAGVSCFL